MRSIVEAVSARDGKVDVATLGNHDSVGMVRPFERMGLDVRVNQTLTVERGGARSTSASTTCIIRDPAARCARRGFARGLPRRPGAFPDFARLAARAGFSLYLTGHTHGGRARLPGGLPIVTSSQTPRAHASGLWREGDMVGFTSRGVGVSSLPVRFNCRGEAAIITLRRSG